MSNYRVLSVEADAKTIKGNKQGYLTGILYLAPHTLAGVGNLCPNATPGCIAGCLNTAGRGAFTAIQQARINKTKRFHSDHAGFMTELVKDIVTLIRLAKRKGFIPVVRLNGTSDLPWENITVQTGSEPGESVTKRSLMEMFPAVQFYDYTKSGRRMISSLGSSWPANYHLTFSRSECNDAVALAVLKLGGNVAVVFSTRKGEALPATWNGYPVINGDTSDLRFLDGPINGLAGAHRGQVVGLYAKGKARTERG